MLWIVFFKGFSADFPALSEFSYSRDGLSSFIDSLGFFESFWYL